MGVPEAVAHEGQRLHGFDVRQVTPLPDLRAVAYRVEHGHSGARLIHIAADDNENLFSVTLPTVPWDDTGAAHILEHSVLGGSRKYPVRQPFFEMLKMSMGTFINAMTGSDYTTYPVASTVRADLFNLADVYFDAVFHPLLTEETFQREGHRLTPADPAEPTGPLGVAGIVYNEMKGYYGQPEVRLSAEAEAALLPDTIYAKDSGGRPEAIPDLTYADLRRFYATYYHPSDAFFFTYGDIPLSEYLAFLDPRLAEFARRPTDAAIARQARWRSPRRTEHEYQVGEGEATTEKTYLLLQWLAGTATDPADDIAFEVLDWILDGNEGAPLRKALVDSKLGQAPAHTGYRSMGEEGVYQVGLKGSEADRAERFERLVLDTLQVIADGEMAPERVAAAFHQAGYGHLEIQSQFPLHLRYRVVEPWRLGADPLAFASMRPHLEACRQRYRDDPRLFNRLIRERLLENPHRLLTVLRPSTDWQPRLDAAFAARMAAVRAARSAEELRHIAAVSADVERGAGTPNPPEAVALLPQLRVADVPAKPRHIPTTTLRVADGIELLRNDVFTNGVNYLQLDLDASGLTEEQWRYVPRYVEAVHKLGAGRRDYEQVAEQVAASSGGIHCFPILARSAAADARGRRRLRFALKALDPQMEDALGVLTDMVFAVNPRDAARLEVVLGQAVAGARTGLVNGGAGTAMRYAGDTLTVEGHLSELMYGGPQLRLVERLHGDFARAGERLMGEIERIRDALAAAGGIVASFTGSDRACDAVAATLAGWRQRLGAGGGGVTPAALAVPAGEARVGLAAPLQVAYCAQLLPAPHYAHPDSPLLAVGAHLITVDYIRPEIRFKGTAYGGSCGYDALGAQLALASWQDPHVARTLGVFAAVGNYVSGATWTQTDVDRAIIATLKDGERPIRPAEATGTALHRHLAGLTPAMRDQRHSATLAATPQSVKAAVLAALETGLTRGATCVLAGRRMLEEGNRELGARALVLRDVLTGE